MTKTLREMLGQDVENVKIPTLDVNEVINQGEQRLRVRRVRTVVGAVVAAAVVVTLIAVGGFVVDSARHQSSRPVDEPKNQKNNKEDTNKVTNNEDAAPVTREIVYYDSEKDTTVHYGSRVVEIGEGWFLMDVTDDGFVFVVDGDDRVLFNDGKDTQQIGSGVCGDEAGHRGVAVKSANEGSLVAWFDCTPPGPAELVVYDTSLGREVVRRPVARCAFENSWCHPDAVLGNRVYFTRRYSRNEGRVRVAALEFDTATSRVAPIESYRDDIRSHPRGLVIGDSWRTGTPTMGLDVKFSVVGSRLIPLESDPRASAPPPSSAFDTATGRLVRLHLPSGYQGASGFRLFEWLDDETVALIGPDEWDDVPGYGDILTCRLTDGRCDLTVPGRGPVRVGANGGHPG